MESQLESDRTKIKDLEKEKKQHSEQGQWKAVAKANLDELEKLNEKVKSLEKELSKELK